jgi:hypothetical protein
VVDIEVQKRALKDGKKIWQWINGRWLVIVPGSTSDGITSVSFVMSNSMPALLECV